ncbi:MAG: hypothetical protein HC859_03120 [Bacteroidia bacterium]|nr:hypothetical protein [Bacteroidia bacterium]
MKIFRAFWFLSFLAAFANLMYVYASLSETVIVQQEGVSPVVLSRDSVFYISLAFLAVVNVLVYVVGRVYTRNEPLRSWFHGLVVTLNIFFIMALSYISLFNSGERFAFDRAGAIVLGSVLLFITWTVAWPVYLISESFQLNNQFDPVVRWLLKIR